MGVHPYRAAWETRDLSQWSNDLAQDVVLRSPIVRAPFRGRKAALELFEVLFDALQDVKITDECDAGDMHMFRWRANASGEAIEGVDLIRHDLDGKVSEITVLIRPLVSIGAFAAAVGPGLARKRVRLYGPLVRAMAMPLTILLTFTDAIASRFIGVRHTEDNP